MVKKQYKVIWSKRSRASLQSIYKYIKKRESQEQGPLKAKATPKIN